MFLTEPPEDGGVRALYDGNLADHGYVSNFTRAWAWRPDVLESFLSTRAITADTLGLTEREFAVLVTATASQRGDSYCSLAWGTRLAERASDEVAAAVVAGTSSDGLTERERTLASWARACVHDPNGTTQSDVDGLRAVGLSDRDIFGLTAFVAFRLAFSTINDALGARPDRQVHDSTPASVREAVRYGRSADD
ncbi:MAG: hypothetical protein WAN48_13340 [Actinomycetes bacterium]